MELESGDPVCRRLFHGEDGAPNEDSDREDDAILEEPGVVTTVLPPPLTEALPLHCQRANNLAKVQLQYRRRHKQQEAEEEDHRPDSDSEETAEEAASFMSAGDDQEPDKAPECLDEMLGNIDVHVRQWVIENDCFKTDEIDEIIQNRTKQLNAATMPLCNTGSSTPSSVRQKTRRGCFTQRRLSSASATN